MTKKYQTTERGTSALAVPEQVSVDERDCRRLREGPFALAVGAGLQMMAQLVEADVTAACGPRGKHDRDRTATRHGTRAWAAPRSAPYTPAAARARRTTSPRASSISPPTRRAGSPAASW